MNQTVPDWWDEERRTCRSELVEEWDGARIEWRVQSCEQLELQAQGRRDEDECSRAHDRGGASSRAHDRGGANDETVRRFRKQGVK